MKSPKSIRNIDAKIDIRNSPKNIFKYHPRTGLFLFLLSAISPNMTLLIELEIKLTGCAISRKAIPYTPICAIGIYFTNKRTGRLEEKLSTALASVKYFGKSMYRFA